MKRIFIYICLVSLGLNFPSAFTTVASQQAPEQAKSPIETVFSQIQVVVAEASSVIVGLEAQVERAGCSIHTPDSLTKIQETVSPRELLACNQFQVASEVTSFPSLAVIQAPSSTQNISIAVEGFIWEHLTSQGATEPGLVAVLPINVYLGGAERWSLSERLTVPLTYISLGKSARSVSSLAEIQMWRC